MKTKKMIPHNKLTLGKEEQEAANRVLSSGWLAAGSEVKAFEDDICQFVNLPEGHAVAVSSGTAALYLVLKTLNVTNTFVETPVYACAALRNAIAMANATPKYQDNIINSVQADLSIPLTNISATLPYGASIQQHSYGFISPPPNRPFTKVIEDCAQALGSKINGNHVGLEGIAGVFSFYATKIITSGGQGGMIIAKNKNIIDEIKDYLAFDCRYDEKERFNFQMTDLQAAIAREQLKKLPYFIKRRHDIFEQYAQELPMLVHDTAQHKNAENVRYRALINVDTPDLFIKTMNTYNIKCINPMEQKELQSKNYSNYPNAVKVTKKFVSLPIYPTLTDKQVKTIIHSAEKSL